MQTIKIIENFRSFQGEGPYIGRAMLILRFKYCDRVEHKNPCAFCDTLLKLRINTEFESKIEEIQKIISDNRLGVLLTGGEPTFESHFDDTLNLLNQLQYTLLNVETNGYRLYELIQKVDPTKNIKFMYSPKIFTEKELEFEIEKTEKVIDDKRVYIKVVYEDNILIKRYLEYLTKRIVGIPNEFKKVWLMPEGASREQLIRNSEAVFDACEKYKFNFSSRSHIIFGFI